MKSIRLSSALAIASAIAAGSLLTIVGCTSAEVRQQAYAKLGNERTFEESMPTVWKALESALEKYKIVDRDPEEVSILEMRKLTRRTLKTDWIYGRSRDKYQEYRVNNLPRTVYLQVRFRYEVTAKTVIGGVHLSVSIEEEIEKLNSDGTSLGYSSADQPDPMRAGEFLDGVQKALHSNNR